MSDIADEIPATGLDAIAAYPHGTGYVLALLDDRGNMHAHHMTEQKLRSVFYVIGQALKGEPVSSMDSVRDAFV